MFMEYNVYDLLEKICVRTGMYIGETKLEKLMSFLAGYHFAMDSIGAIDVSQPDFRDFHNWISAKYGFYESTSSWANMILVVELGLNPRGDGGDREDCKSNATEIQHENSVRTFFKLVDEFKNS